MIFFPAAGVGMVRLLAALMAPYMPSLAAKILAQINLPYEPTVALTDELMAGAYKWVFDMGPWGSGSRVVR